MKLTILLTLGEMLLLFLMILAATVFMPLRALAKNFPEDVQETLKPRLDAMDKGPRAGRRVGLALLIPILAGMLALAVYGGIDGRRNGFSFWQQLGRQFIIAYGVKAFDIIALDYFLVSKSHFFQHFLPETEGCAGYKQFGYNRKQQLRQILLFPIFCVTMALIFS